MTDPMTQQTIRQFTGHVSRQLHAMAGATIAASAAQSAALGRACMHISAENSGGAFDAASEIAQMDQLQTDLLGWCDRDATAITEFVALREAGDELAGQQFLCHSPAEISRLALEAGQRVQAFRPLVNHQVRDDLEMALTLLAGAARAAMLLLDSNLRHWPEPALLEQFEPVIDRLLREIGALKPVQRLR
ncbi:MAG: hypothetical protein FOGNACKC_00158 [Anaerolineae bacterium]|nr:hypothetical protein [Anaerolineae bacterium]